MAIESLRALMEAGENQDLCDIIIHSDCVDRGVTKEASFEKMRALYAAIRRARAGYDPALRSASGMVGGDGAKMRAYVQSGKTICGDYIGQVIAQALEMGESNACMKCIVAAPTAGSCGVLPAVLLPYQAREGLDDNTMVRAMYVAGAIGQVVAATATSRVWKFPSRARRAAVRRKSARPARWARRRSATWAAATRRLSAMRRPSPSRACSVWSATRLRDWWKCPA